MEQHTDNMLMKIRSGGACVTTGLRLYMSNFRRIFRYTWPAALFYGIVASFIGTLTVTTYPKLMAALLTNPASDVVSHFMSLVIAYGVASLLGFFAVVLLVGSGMSVLWQHQQTGVIGRPARWFSIDRRTLVRTLVAFIFIVVLLAVVYMLSAVLTSLVVRELGMITGIALMTVVFIVFLVLTLPFDYVTTKYVLFHRYSLFKHIAVGYTTGMRHAGLIFVVAFIMALIVMVCTLFTAMPAFILSSASLRAYSGTIGGDPLGMPSYIGVLTAVTLLLSGFIQAYIILLHLFPSYYVYGSIETQEDERAEAMKKIK